MHGCSPSKLGRARKSHPVACVPVEVSAGDVVTLFHHMLAGKHRNLLSLGAVLPGHEVTLHPNVEAAHRYLLGARSVRSRQEPSNCVEQQVRVDRHREEFSQAFGMLTILYEREKENLNVWPFPLDHASERNAV